MLRLRERDKQLQRLLVKRFSHDSDEVLFHFVMPPASVIKYIIFYKENAKDSAINITFRRSNAIIKTYEGMSTNELLEINMNVEDGGIISCLVSKPNLTKCVLFYE